MDAMRVYNLLLAEHQGDVRRALYDLASRYVALAQGVSPGFLRMPPDVPPVYRVDDVPTPITDDWIKTAKEG